MPGWSSHKYQKEHHQCKKEERGEEKGREKKEKERKEEKGKRRFNNMFKLQGTGMHLAQSSDGTALTHALHTKKKKIYFYEYHVLLKVCLEF